VGERKRGVPGMKHVKDIIAGLGAFIVAMALIVGVFGGAIYTGLKNSEKVQHMNQLCLARGFSGWQDGGRYDSSRCVK